MPNRILKDSICTSDNLDVLTAEQEVFWYRLLVQCDDYGRMDARPSVLRARCFPLRLDQISEADVVGYIAALVAASLIIVYQIDSKPYLQIATWDKHQQIRAKRSKYPPMISSDISRKHPLSDAPENPIQSESKAESESEVESNTRQPAAASAPLAAAVRSYENAIGFLPDGTVRAQIVATFEDLERIEHPEWWQQAIDESVAHNARSWAYMRKILERWIKDGRTSSGAPGRNGSQPPTHEHPAITAMKMVQAERAKERAEHGHGS